MNQHWARISERGTVIGMTVMVNIQRHLGHWPFRLVLWPVILWYFLLHRTARRSSQAYLQRLFPHLTQRPLARWWHSYQHFLAFGGTLMDKVAAWSGNIADECLGGSGVENFSTAIEGGRGGLILVAHHGNLDVVSALTERHPGLGITVMVHTRNARKFNSLLERVTQKTRPDILEVSEVTPATAQTLAERIHTGGYVVIAADRTPLSGERTRSLDFLGAQARFPEGPFQLAALLRCPLYTLSCVRQHDGFQIDFEAFDDTQELSRRQREDWISDAMQRHANHLAKRVQQHPLQWFNFYPFWMNDPGYHHDNSP